MIRRIVVPLDGSRLGAHALASASAIARRAGAHVHLVRVYRPPFSATHVRGVRMYDPALETSGKATCGAYLESVATQLRESSRVQCTCTVLAGDPAEQLANFVVASRADLVVMSSHGEGSPSVTWMGSVTDRLIRWSAAPLFVTRVTGEGDAPAAVGDFSKILVPLDGSEVAERVLGPIGAFAALWDSQLLLVRVELPLPPAPAGADPSEANAYLEPNAAIHRNAASYLASVSRRLVEKGLHAETRLLLHPYPARVLLAHAEEYGARIVALATHGRGGLRKLILGSVADKLLRGASMPLLLVGPEYVEPRVDASP